MIRGTFRFVEGGTRKAGGEGEAARERYEVSAKYYWGRVAAIFCDLLLTLSASHLPTAWHNLATQKRSS